MGAAEDMRMDGRRLWLFKSEPSVFSFDDLLASKKQETFWEGVRNYQARNLLRDEIAVGDGVLFYHSRFQPMAVVGTAVVVQAGSVDPYQFDPKSPYYDSKASKDAPRWYGVTICADKALPRPVTLQALKAGVVGLEDMVLIQKGSRLSVQPVRPSEWKIVLKLGGIG